jgi:hypothetical protein
VSAAAQRRSTRAGEVAERSNAADCKSVALAASEVRILPSPPAFARCASFGWQAGVQQRLYRRRFQHGRVPVGVPFNCPPGARQAEWSGGLDDLETARGRRIDSTSPAERPGRVRGLAPRGQVATADGSGGLAREVRVSGRGVHEGGSNSVVESQPSKLLVAGSIPVSRSNLRSREQA